MKAPCATCAFLLAILAITKQRELENRFQEHGPRRRVDEVYGVVDAVENPP